MHLKEIILKSGIENCLFMIPMLPLRKLSMFGIAWKSSRDEYVKVPAKITQERYPIEEGYKITLKSIYPKFGKDDFYQSDLKSLIEEGYVELFTKVKI